MSNGYFIYYFYLLTLQHNFIHLARRSPNMASPVTCHPSHCRTPTHGNVFIADDNVRGQNGASAKTRLNTASVNRRHGQISDRPSVCSAPCALVIHDSHYNSEHNCVTQRREKRCLSDFTGKTESTLSLHFQHLRDVIMQNDLRERFVASLVTISSS